MVLQAENLLEWKSRRKKSCRCYLSPSTPLPPRSVEVFKLVSFMRKRLNAFPSTNKEAGRSESPCMLKSSIEFIRVVSFFIWSDCIIKIKTKSIIEKLINDIEPPPARIWLVISASNQMRLLLFSAKFITREENPPLYANYFSRLFQFITTNLTLEFISEFENFLSPYFSTIA